MKEVKKFYHKVMLPMIFMLIWDLSFVAFDGYFLINNLIKGQVGLTMFWTILTLLMIHFATQKVKEIFKFRKSYLEIKKSLMVLDKLIQEEIKKMKEQELDQVTIDITHKELN